MRTRTSERGFNLVEVLVAMGLLSVVLLSIFTLFVMGRRNVYSGKQLTQANAVGRNVLEDLANMSLDDVRTTFNIADDEALAAVDVDPTRDLPQDEYTDAILRTTTNISAATDPRGFMESWNDAIVNEEKLAEGTVSLVFLPDKAYPLASTLSPETATVMKLRVLVRWTEGGRRRQAIFDTSKVQRP